jgi:GNAT superfamily N-acetyltransferase
MSLYADYLKEMWGLNTLQSDAGFATYLFDGPECLIDDLYVKPDRRKQGECFELAKRIEGLARERGCKYLTCKTSKKYFGWEGRRTVFLKYGFKEHKIENDMMYFVKELK